MIFYYCSLLKADDYGHIFFNTQNTAVNGRLHYMIYFMLFRLQIFRYPRKVRYSIQYTCTHTPHIY